MTPALVVNTAQTLGGEYRGDNRDENVVMRNDGLQSYAPVDVTAIAR